VALSRMMNYAIQFFLDYFGIDHWVIPRHESSSYLARVYFAQHAPRKTG
jgi:hypothetical protein